LALGGCGKSKQAPPAEAPTTTKAPVAKPEAAPKPAKKTDARAKLGLAYHEIRCMLNGARRPDAETYSKHGFAGAAAFSKAFSEAATADADWASTTIDASIKHGCKQDEAGK